MAYENDKAQTIGMIIGENDADETVTREDWIDGVNRYFDEQERRKRAFEFWSEQASRVGNPNVESVEVQVTALFRDGSVQSDVGYTLTQTEAVAMFHGIREARGWVAV